ncbi:MULTISPECIES: RagB/SusD family nutrient uptake outer membrane protein [unclassified Pedobacter]|uniref:RagB/SusD family nutrient uptake outer membrane protein n=1 Tax=unclassified Pedobacter TaxID=2628915 RepID=UPI001D68F3CF|nr:MULTISPECIES: RagB/SusD family nutrient uptake outer membrane protein [unclassified Pedobacter]CAH0252203.1 SusD-like protein BACOVA_02651 [Pedobacter sp. Bi36]CAH0276922.1 SusD-like protein BACOVA_02651 [Pedobacter sp. Bi126]
MKHIKYILLSLLICSTFSCKKEFLELQPQGELTEEQLMSQEGVEGLLIGSYSLLNGNLDGTWGNYGAAPSQWLFGEVASDNAHKGSSTGDQPPMNAIEQHSPTSTNDNISNIWNRCFEGIQRCNRTLKVLASLQAGSGSAKFDDARAKEIQGEARLLRGHYYFFLVRIFKMVPYVTEANSGTFVPNDKDIYPNIVDDLQFAVANLSTTKPKNQKGRVDKYAAQAYLGKVLLYQKKYTEAYDLLNAVILAKPSLVDMPYTDNFDITKEDGPETIMSVQHSVGTDGTGGDNGNVGDMLNFPYGNAPINCCGFFQPTIDLANSFKVDALGLPLLDGSYRTNPYKSDYGLTGADKTNYAVDKTLPLDPRIESTIGRRGVPYRDWGLMPGDTWIRDASNGGPFLAVKNTIDAAQISSGTAPGSSNVTGLNVNLIRLADVYLMAAECAVEKGDLGRALILVNAVRARAAKITPRDINGTPAAAYKVSQYTSFPNDTYARNAVRFERRLELALEGHRFFDLVRWGVAKQTLESYFSFEGGYFNYLKGITIETRDDYFPLPQDQIDRSNGTLKQSPGY